MLDPELQQRFMRHCTDAAFGYSAASTAAYAAFTEQVFGFWTSILQPTPPKRGPDLWRWPVPFSQPSSSTALTNPFAWALPQAPPPIAKAPALPTNPWEAMAQFAEAMSGALGTMSGMPVKTTASTANPMTAWLTAFPFAPPTAAWPWPS